jgi:hypothetical protein
VLHLSGAAWKYSRQWVGDDCEIVVAFNENEVGANPEPVRAFPAHTAGLMALAGSLVMRVRR